MTVKNKRVLIVIAPRDFNDDELLQPIRHFEDNDITFEIISSMKGMAVGMKGGKVLIEHTIEEAEVKGPDSYSALFIVGGNGSPYHLWPDKNLEKVVRKFDIAEKIIGAICLAPVVLAKAGVIKGKSVTSWSDDTAIDELIKNGAIFKPDPIVVDGRIITANGPLAASGFGEKLTKMILK